MGKAAKAIRGLISGRIDFDIDLIPFRYESLPRKKILNWIATESSVVIKPSRPRGLPTILQVEPTSRCNLRCLVCPVASGLERPGGDMDFSLYKGLIDELEEALLLVMFWDWGEPFLNPKAYEMINYARSREIKVMASTNGHAFAAGDHAREVVESGLDVLVFSVDGITQETYRRYRRGGDLDAVLEGIRRVVSEKKRQNSQTPLVNFRFIVMRHGEEELGNLQNFVRPLGVDVLTVRRFHEIPTAPGGQRAKEQSLAPVQGDYRLPRVEEGKKAATRVKVNPCRNLWNCPTVHWDGTVCSCFMDFNEQRPLGSLRRESFRQIWSGSRYQQLRRQFRTGWRDTPLCGVCSSGYEGGDVGRESTAEVHFL